MKELAVVVLALSVAVVVADDAPLVMTEGGRISGQLQNTTKGRDLYSYYNIPFAKPPLGDLRFKDPVPAEPWEGVRDGSKMPEPCLQIPFGLAVRQINVPPNELLGSEDCLYLNVFTPVDKGLTPELPVMVWIHGGGYFAGGAHEYPPHVLLNHDVVLVVIQYRLGVIGFLSTEDSVIPGNFALKDQTLALQWVQRNIHNFGGDKTKVTIFGESAGGVSVHFQMLSPKSKGLFSRVIMQSGSALSPWATGCKFRETAEEIGQKMGCPISEDTQALLDCLQKVDGRSLAAELQDYFQWFVLPMVFGPRVDGDFIPDDPAKLVHDGKYHKVDLMAGVTSNEGALSTQTMLVNENLISALKMNFTAIGPLSIQLMEAVDGQDVVELARRVYHYYLGEELNIDEDHSEALTQMFSDTHFAINHDLVTKNYVHHVHRHNTYRYNFGYRGEFSFCNSFDKKVGKHWVTHADDLLYLFQAGDVLGFSKELQHFRTPEDQRMREIMSTLWTNFAATGNPTPDGSLGFTWEPSTEDNFQYLALNLKSTMEADQRQEVRKFFASLPLRINRILYPDGIPQDDILQHEDSRSALQDEL